jgi:hypothetical protein
MMPTSPSSPVKSVRLVPRSAKAGLSDRDALAGRMVKAAPGIPISLRVNVIPPQTLTADGSMGATRASNDVVSLGDVVPSTQ